MRLLEIRSSTCAGLHTTPEPPTIRFFEESTLIAIGSWVFKCLVRTLLSITAAVRQYRTRSCSNEMPSDNRKRNSEAEDTGTTSVQGRNKCTMEWRACPSNSDDAWIDDWDLIIHRCNACNKPFRSTERLEHHRAHHCSDAPVEAHEFCASPISSASIVPIDKGGDLEIRVGPDEDYILKCFIVASQVLRCQSRAFYASFCESYAFKGSINIRRARLLRPYEPGVIFLDDDPDALELILMALHHRYLELPQKIEFKVLVEVAAVCEKYMLHVPLAPLAAMWAEPWKAKAFEKGYENWLLIAWVFGVDDMFVNISKHIALNLAVAPENGLVRHDGKRLHQAIPKSVTGE